MKVALAGIAIFVPLAVAQIPEAYRQESAPIYHVTVVSRTLSAVNYQHRSGPTEIDYKGTVLMPAAHGQAIVESKKGRVEIDSRFDHLESRTDSAMSILPMCFGPSRRKAAQ